MQKTIRVDHNSCPKDQRNQQRPFRAEEFCRAFEKHSAEERDELHEEEYFENKCLIVAGQTLLLREQFLGQKNGCNPEKRLNSIVKEQVPDQILQRVWQAPQFAKRRSQFRETDGEVTFAG